MVYVATHKKRPFVSVATPNARQIQDYQYGISITYPPVQTSEEGFPYIKYEKCLRPPRSLSPPGFAVDGCIG